MALTLVTAFLRLPYTFRGVSRPRLDFQPFWESGIILLPTNGWITGPYHLSVTSHPLFMRINMTRAAREKMAEVVTPKKPVRSFFSSLQKCVLCRSVLDNPRKRIKLKQELVSKLQEIVASENLDK